MSKKYRTTLVKTKRLNDEAIEVSFQRPKDFQFRAGQYIQFSVDKLLYPDPSGSSRVMSVASSPFNQQEISVIFRDTGSGFKETIKELEAGTEITLEGPYGFFNLSEKSLRPVVLIAGGIGITPYISMINYALEAKLDAKITLLYCSRSLDSAIFLNELKKLAKHSKLISICHKVGWIDEQFVSDNVPDAEHNVWYIAGPPAMVANTRNLLFGLGIEDNLVITEEFIGYQH